MKWNYLISPLGDASPIGCHEKRMPIPLAIPLIMAAASAATSIYSGVKSSNAAKEEKRKLEEEKARTEAERRRRLNEDYIDTAAGQNLLRIAREERDKTFQRAAGAGAVSGATDAAMAQAKEQGNRVIGDTIANIASQDTMRKDNMDSSYRSEISRITQQEIAAERAKADAISQAASGVSSSLMQGAMSTFGGTKLGQSWFNSGGNSGVTTPSSQVLSSYNNNYGVTIPYIQQYLNGGGRL